MRLPILSLLFVLLLAAPAAADSIVYAKDGNIWAARPDGSGAVQITRDGTAASRYGDATQADDGTVLAVRGDRFHRFSRRGDEVGRFGSVLTDKPGAISAFGPWDSRISPDGRKVAYWLGIMGGWYDYGTGTYYSDPESAVVYQDAVTGAQLGQTMFYEEPSWQADSEHLLLWESLNALTPQVTRGMVGQDHNQFQGWFHDSDVFADSGGWKPIGGGELSRDGSRLALLRASETMGNGGEARGLGNTLVFFDVAGFDGPPRALACGFSDDHGSEMGPPSWSPDGHRVAWATAEGIWVGTIGSPASCDGWSMQLVIPGGLEPDWGPAEPAAGGGGGDDGGHGGGAVAVDVKKRVRRSKLLRRGLALDVACPAECTVDAVARSRRRKVGRAYADGPGRLVVPVSRKVRRGKLKLRVTVRPQVGEAQTIARVLKVR